MLYDAALIEDPDRVGWGQLASQLKAGSHVLIVGGFPDSAFQARMMGLESRDTIAHLFPGGWEPILLFRKPLQGGVVDNLRRHGVGGLRVESCRAASGRWPSNLILSHARGCRRQGRGWVCAQGCPVRKLDEQSGVRTSGGGNIRRIPWSGFHGGDGVTGMPEISYADSGGASRFFPQFDGPEELRQWLISLVCPPEGTLLRWP